MLSSSLSVPLGDVVVVEPTGRILGGVGTETAGGSLVGTGVIDNSGVIALDASFVSVTVMNKNYLVTFDGATDTTVRLFARDFTSGYRTVPDPTPGTVWNTEPDGSGLAFDASTGVFDDLTLFEAVWVESAEITPAATTVPAGTPVTYTVTAKDSLGDTYTPAPTVNLSSDGPGDVVAGLDVTATVAGPRTVTAEIEVGGAVVATADAQLTVTPADAANLTITPSATTVRQGGSLTFTIGAEDGYGNPGAPTSGAVLTSSVPSDKISGMTVTFPHASPHTITVTLGPLSASTVIQVIPARADSSG